MQNNLKIIKLQATDAEELSLLENMFFTQSWTKEQFKTAINSNNYLLYGIKIDNIIITYISIRIIPEISKLSADTKGELEILNIATHVQYQHKGYAHQLLSYVIEFAKNNYIESLFLDVRISNIFAIALYKKHNFLEIQRRKNYYTTAKGKEDAIIMQKIL